MSHSRFDSEFQVDQPTADVVDVMVRGIKIRLRLCEQGILVNAFHSDDGVVGINPTTQVETRFTAPYRSMVVPYESDSDR